MWATRPHLGSIFEKLLHRKTFCLPAARGWQSWFLGKTVFPVRQKGVPPLLLPASVLQLPRCLVRICNLFYKDNQLRIGKFQKMQLHQKNLLQIQFASQMWAARPHLASIFEKLLDQKTFCLPAARGWQSWFLGKTVFPVRQKGVPPLLLPASVLQLPRCLVRICNLFHKSS